MAATETNELAVYRIKTVFPGANTKKHDLVRASSRQRAKWWAKEKYDRGVVEGLWTVDPTGRDEEIVDVGGWEQ